MSSRLVESPFSEILQLVADIPLEEIFCREEEEPGLLSLHRSQSDESNLTVEAGAYNSFGLLTTNKSCIRQDPVMYYPKHLLNFLNTGELSDSPLRFHSSFSVMRYLYPEINMDSPAFSTHAALVECNPLRNFQEFMQFWTVLLELVPDACITAETTPRRCCAKGGVFVYTIGVTFHGTPIHYELGKQVLMKDYLELAQLSRAVATGMISTSSLLYTTSTFSNYGFASNPKSYLSITQNGSLLIYVNQQGEVLRLDWYFQA